MAHRTGRCTNDLYCSTASAGQIIHIPLDTAFVCPHCGKTLAPPPLQGGRLSNRSVFAIGGLVIGAGLLFTAGAVIGGGPAAPEQETTYDQDSAAGAIATEPPAPDQTQAARIQTVQDTVIAARQHTAAATMQARLSSVRHPVGELARPPNTAAPQVLTASATQHPQAAFVVWPPDARATPNPTLVVVATATPVNAGAEIAAPMPSAPLPGAPASTNWPASAPPVASALPAASSDAPASQPSPPLPTPTMPVHLAMLQAQQEHRALPQTQPPFVQSTRPEASIPQPAPGASRPEATDVFAQYSGAEAARREEQREADKFRRQQVLEQKRRQLLAQQAADADARMRQEVAQAREAEDATQQAARAAAAEQTARQAAAQQSAKDAAARDAVAKTAQATPKGPTRGFSSRVIAGGKPTYPSAYEEENRVGQVQVSCLIGQNGAPDDCHVLGARGGVGFTNAALGWLQSGRVRFQPIMRNGEPVAEQHVFDVSFEP